MDTLDTFAFVYLLFVAGAFGLVMGSFVNCWAWRAMHGESVLEGRSHCTSCGHVLGPCDLVPLFSWLASRGRCRYCGAPVSWRYPATELVSGLTFVAIAVRYGLSLETLELCAFASVLLFLSLTDIDDFIIPNPCILCALAIRVCYLVASLALGTMTVGEVGYYLASAVGVSIALLATVLLVDLLLGRESMGGGDLKLYAVAALYFGWQQMLFLVILSCVLGLLSSVAFARRAEQDAAGEGKGVSRPFPFGPSIAVACVITMLVGSDVVAWYWGLFW